MSHRVCWLGVVAGLLFGAPIAAQQELPRVPTLNEAAVLAVVEGARAEAVRNNWNVVIAVVDASGVLLHLSRMDGVQSGSVTVAQDKARSAALFRRPTRVFGEMVSQGNVGLLALTGAVPVEGGEPLTVDGIVVGAIGVSGVTSAQDGIIARAGGDALGRAFRD
jgi:glc operon protein GlcG